MKIKYEVIFMQNEYEKLKTRMKIDSNLRLQFLKDVLILSCFTIKIPQNINYMFLFLNIFNLNLSSDLIIYKYDDYILLFI